MEGDRVLKFHFKDKKGVEQRILLWCQSGDIMLLLNCCQHFFRQMIRLLKHKFHNKLFEEKTAHTLDIPRRLRQRGDAIMQNL